MAVADAALDLDAGDFGGPIETSTGAVLFEVVERKHFDARQFEEEKVSTREMLESQQLNEILAVLVDKRRAEMNIEFDPQLLANFGLDGDTADS